MVRKVLLSTQDRDFGDAVAEELIVLRNLNFETFRGNLSLCERERYKKAGHKTKMKEAQDKQKKHMEKTVANNTKAAREKGDDRKLNQAASRKKNLDERMGIEVGLKGGRFKLNRDLAGSHLCNRAEFEVPDFDPPVKVAFPRQPPDLRFPGSLVSLEKVSFAYPGRRKLPVLTDIDLTVHPGERVGLASLNGSGKTTLVSLIVGSRDDDAAGGLTPTSGSITRHTRAKFGRFSQQSVEELTGIAASNLKLTALSHLREHCGENMDEKDARQTLGSLGLLCRASQGSSIALREYEGALLVVTHDRFFMRTVVEGSSPYELAPGVHVHADSEPEFESDDEEETGVTAGTVYRLVKNGLKKLDSGMDQYEGLASRAAA